MQITSEVSEIQWNKFVAENSSPASFLQSWQWGEFQASLGLKIYRLAVSDGGGYQAVAQVIIRPLNLGRTYLEVPKGPVFGKVVSSKLISSIIEELKKIGKAENAILIRINPPYESGLQLTTYNFITPALLLKQTEPEDTVLIDLTKSEEDLLVKMHEKSRYNIRLAMKKGARVFEKTRDDEAFKKFLELIGETAKRDGITVWPQARFEKFRQQFLLSSPLRGEDQGGGDKPHAVLLTGEYEGKTLAAAIVMLFGDAGTYLYAASSAEQRNANVPSLVLWEAIRQAKARGKKYYDMWGIAPVGAGESHSWAGITRFKSRYVKLNDTGVEKHYVGTWDMVLDKKYYSLFKAAKFIRGIIKK